MCKLWDLLFSHCRVLAPGSSKLTMCMCPISQVQIFRRYIAREVAHHASLIHPLIVGAYEAFLTPHCLGLAMEWVPGGSLLDLLNSQPYCRFPEPVARLFFQQLIISLNYVHRRVSLIP